MRAQLFLGGTDDFIFYDFIEDLYLFIYFNFFSHFNTSVLINQNTVTIIVIW